jgi:hypothetical protein
MPILRDRLTVGQQPLELFIQVRILVPQLASLALVPVFDDANYGVSHLAWRILVPQPFDSFQSLRAFGP